MKRISFYLSIALLAVSGSAWSATGTKLQIGSPIPNISALAQDGSEVSFPDQGKTGYLLVYFYPKAMTAGCTAQACSLRDAYVDLQGHGIKVLGVSADPVATQKEFKEKEHLPFTLISDPDHRVTASFGVPLLNNALATRQAYLFKDGKLVWFDTHAATDRQATDVLAVVNGKNS
jgi:peroxiredoxin Q/BCP